MPILWLHFLRGSVEYANHRYNAFKLYSRYVDYQECTHTHHKPSKSCSCLNHTIIQERITHLAFNGFNHMNNLRTLQ
ncbi:hypothetical protein CW304_13495 [Bacillus sp. UFRGS-B20]|nr:hypothetical protein CW304_13495 [Bacillus sp. UFRGS-B20]